MRKRIGIGVVAAALLFGLVAPGVSDPKAGNDQVVTAGVGADIGEIARALGRGIRALLPFIEHDGPAIRAAARELEAMIPTAVRTPWGGEVELGARQRWQLINVACVAKDVYQLQREDEVYKQLAMLGEELPDHYGLAVKTFNLANELAEAKDNGDRVQKAAVAAACTAAERALE
jgi:hypothetical protein